MYNINFHKPQVAGICDIDGSELYQRSDDKGEAVQKRLDIFFTETIHLLDYYGEQHKAVTVNGNQDIDQVQKDLLSVINSCTQIQGGKEIAPWQIQLLPEKLPPTLGAN